MSMPQNVICVMKCNPSLEWIDIVSPKRHLSNRERSFTSVSGLSWMSIEESNRIGHLEVKYFCTIFFYVVSYLRTKISLQRHITLLYSTKNVDCILYLNCYAYMSSRSLTRSKHFWSQVVHK